MIKITRDKNIKVKLELLQNVKSLLLNYFKLSMKSCSGDLKDFVEELAAQQEDKFYTQKRATKVSVGIRVYFNINKLKFDESIEELLHLFEKGIESQAARVFAKTAQEILTIIHYHPSRSFLDAELFFIDEDAKKKIIEACTRLEGSYSNKSDERLFKITRIINVLNDKDVCFKYDVKYVSKFKQINRELSVKKYLPGHYAVWRNSTIKEHKEYIRVHSIKGDNLKRLQNALEIKLSQAADEEKYITENSQNLEVRIIGLENAVLHPRISITTKKHTNDKHLRSEVPNALWFSPAPFRSDMSADEFINSSKNAFGDVYYKNKED